VALSDLFSRRRKDDTAPELPASGLVTHPTKVLPRFLSTLGARHEPVLLDLGSVVGSNVSFFGEQLGCKIFVEDLAADIDRHAKEGILGRLPEFLATRFSQADESVDGVLCWDLIDYLDKPAAQALAAQLSRVLKPEGVLVAFFATAAPSGDTQPSYSRYVVENVRTLQSRAHPAARAKQRPLQNRDIQLMFAPLAIAEQFLLKTHMREVLFRKPAAAAPAPTAS
jgi:cyclopropane fatty-acyl-phospholipid synthase-like methyltransferase